MGLQAALVHAKRTHIVAPLFCNDLLAPVWLVDIPDSPINLFVGPVVPCLSPVFLPVRQGLRVGIVPTKHEGF